MASSQKKSRKTNDQNGGEDTSEKPQNDEELQRALEDMDYCQNEIDALNEQVSQDILKIEQKYNDLRIPCYEKRSEIISKIPRFWVTTFVNHPDLSTMIEDSEEDCLQHLVKIEVKEFDDIVSGYRIDFHFEENPYFENSVLTKEFRLQSKEEPSSTNTPIKWKEGFDLTQNNCPNVTKSGRKRSADQKSFFMWYNNHSDPLTDDIGEIIKDDVWINPLQYFLVPDVKVENDAEEEEEEEGSEQEDDNDTERLPIVIEDTDEDTVEIQTNETEDQAAT